MSKVRQITRFVIFTQSTRNVVSKLLRTREEAEAGKNQLNDYVGFDKYAAGCAFFSPDPIKKCYTFTKTHPEDLNLTVPPPRNTSKTP